MSEPNRRFKRRASERLKTEKNNRPDPEDIIVLSSRSPTPQAQPATRKLPRVAIAAYTSLGVVFVFLLITNATMKGWMPTITNALTDMGIAGERWLRVSELLGLLESTVRDIIMDYRHQLAMLLEPASNVCICPCQTFQ